MKSLWYTLYGIYSFMIISGFFWLYYFFLKLKFYPESPEYMQSIVSYFRNRTIIHSSNSIIAFPYLSIVLIIFGSIGFYYTSKLYQKVKKFETSRID